ncbi:MAG: THUMP domain-containing protein [Candidatus Woesearchaeota archaeon]
MKNMNALAITSIGIEDICSSEIKDLINADSKPHKGCVEFNIKKPQDLFKLCYLSQSSSRILLLLSHFMAGSSKSGMSEKSIKSVFLNELKKNISKIDFSEWLDDNIRFAVNCQRIGIHDFNSADIEKAAAFSINNSNSKVDLKNPDIIIYIYLIDNDCYIGIDFSGKDLSKRDYKIFSNIRSLKPNIAYSLVRIADFRKGQIMIDPFCGSGEIPIEATLFENNFPQNHFSKDSFAFLNFKKFKDFDFEVFFDDIDKDIRQDKTSIYAYDNQLKNIMAVKKNAKIASIQKYMSISRVDIDWLETKFKQNSVDRIITHIPDVPKHNDPKPIIKVLDDFFWEAEFILKPSGSIVTISRSIESLKQPIKKYKFTIKQTREVWQGKEKLIVLEILKNNQPTKISDF